MQLTGEEKGLVIAASSPPPPPSFLRLMIHANNLGETVHGSMQSGDGVVGFPPEASDGL